MEKKLITEKEAAELLARAPATLRFWRVKKTGPEYVRDPRGRIRYSTAKIEEWIFSGEKQEGGI